jgi:sedoheptulokinase
MKAIGIDIGTTSICFVTIDINNGNIIKSKTINSNAFINSNKKYERIQSVNKIIKIIDDEITDFIDREVEVIGVTGQMHGILYVDKEGKAVSDLYTWQDKRGDEPYLDTTYAKFLNSYSGYGCVSDFYNKINNLYYFKKQKNAR